MFNKRIPLPIIRCAYCQKLIRYSDTFCPGCGNPNDNWLEANPPRCENCNTKLEPHDKYCRVCGTKIGDTVYNPRNDIMECLYGPMPEDRTHTCEKCGFSWTTCMMVDNQKYCPKCGGYAPYSEDDGWDFFDV